MADDATKGDELSRLVRQRRHDVRLDPERALRDVEEAAGFLEERGVVIRTADCSLPGLYDACHEEPYLAAGRGFASWPRTKWTYFAELEQRPGVLALKVHNGKLVLFSPPVVRLLDPICRAELARMSTSDPQWGRLLDHLKHAGPSELGSLRIELGLSPREMRALRHPLERCGAVVSRSVLLDDDGRHEHSAVLFRYDQVAEKAPDGPADPRRALEEVVVAGVRAAVLARESEISKWFSWRWYAGADLCDSLVSSGRLRRLGDGLVTAVEL